jgi:adenylate cyclase
MKIWSNEIKDLEKLYNSLKSHYPKIEKELEKLIKTDDENMVLVYARRCLEVIITDLSERELKRPRGTEPLKGIIDRLNKEEKIPYNITVSMQNLNSLSTFGAHPKDFDPRQVKPVILDLTTIVDWYLKYAKNLESGEVIQGTLKDDRKISSGTQKISQKPKNKIILISAILLACVAVLIALVLFDVIGGGKKAEAKPIESLAILPFNNYTGDDDLDYFVSGMHSALIGDVGQISGLRVISETSSKAYKNIDKSVSDIASELKVDGIIEASVMCLGDSICLQLKLINAGDKEEVLWTGNYKEEKSQILNLYSRLTKNIANEVKINLTTQEEYQLAEFKIVNTEAYDAYLKGQVYWDRLGADDLSTAMEYFNFAIQKDPEWAPPYAGLAKVWLGRMQMGSASPDIAMARIYENINKALDLDPDFTDSHFLNAAIAVWIEWDWEKGEKEFITALKLDPNDVMSRIYYAHLLMTLRRTDEALSQGKIAIDLDPLNPLVQALYAVVFIAAEDYKSALAHAEKAVSIDPNHFFANNILDWVYFWNGDSAKSIETITKYLPWLEDEALTDIKHTYENHGYTAAMNKMTTEMEEAARVGYVLPFDLASYLLRTNKTEKALEWYEKAYEIHDPNMPYINTNFAPFDKIKDNPRFIKLLEQMNLPLK